MTWGVCRMSIKMLRSMWFHSRRSHFDANNVMPEIRKLVLVLVMGEAPRLVNHQVEKGENRQVGKEENHQFERPRACYRLPGRLARPWPWWDRESLLYSLVYGTHWKVMDIEYLKAPVQKKTFCEPFAVDAKRKELRWRSKVGLHQQHLLSLRLCFSF